MQRLKDELIHTVSYELRISMTSVLGFGELLVTRQLSEEKRQLDAQTPHIGVTQFGHTPAVTEE